ncbi:hypothetical protein J4479_05860 [Candidatus Woesearchaeota archaeon]|nr:hypothetical protein [Candidatus Woesearchaeota archaeon]
MYQSLKLIGPSLNQTKPVLDLSSVREAASTLYSEAIRQLRIEAEKRQRDNQARGLFVKKYDLTTNLDSTVSAAAISSRYETLVREYMLNPNRLRKGDTESNNIQLFDKGYISQNNGPYQLENYNNRYQLMNYRYDGPVESLSGNNDDD